MRVGWGEHGTQSQKGSSGFSLADVSDVLVPVFSQERFTILATYGCEEPRASPCSLHRSNYDLGDRLLQSLPF